MSLKVTVVVPTYNSGVHIDPLIDAMKRQTLPADAFEVLFADDGSTDGTPDRLEELAARDPLFRVLRLENSGWPGRPRNVAIEQARGEYIQFVDHDDSMGPEALERMYAMGARNGSDIVIGKVTITHRLRGAPQALMSRNRESVTYRTAALHDSLTVHKMYRTAFLREQGIRFPVGHYVGEDLLFMVPAVFRAAAVSIVGDYPCYYYLEREDGGHATPDRLDPASYSRNLREIFDALLAETEAATATATASPNATATTATDAEPDPGRVRDTWLRRFWRADMVKYLSEPLFPGYPDDFRDEILQALRAVAADYLTEGVYDGLTGLERPRAALVRAGRTADLAELTRRAATMEAHAELGAAHWHRDRLRLTFDARFTCGDGQEPLTVERHGDRYLLHPALTAGLGVDPVDVTDELTRFRLDAFLRHRGTAVKWMLPRDLDVEFEELPGGAPGGPVPLRPVIRATVAVDPRRAAGGHAPDEGVWELQVRVMGPGLDRSTDLTATAASPAIPAGTVGGVRVSAAAPEGDGLALTVETVEPVETGEPAGPAGPAVTTEPGRAPLVSVVLPAGDDAEQLAASLASLTAQTWPPDAYEVLLVRDASQAVPEPLPAGVRLVPGDGDDPRDTGAAAALGTYLLFLRPGDRLGAEALQRMYAYGLEHDADVVAGKLAAAKGRPVPQELYTRDRPQATLAKDPLADSLTAEKLFDRAMVGRHAIRFGPSRHPLAEQSFTVRALLHARRTAVLGSYVCCYYAPASKPPEFLPAPYYARLREVLATADGLTEPGAARDRLHRRWLRVELLERLGGTRLLDLDDDGRRDLLAEVRATLDGSISPTALAGLSARQRLTAALVTEERTDDLLELARWERTVACGPLLREVDWRDGALTVSFTAHLAADGRPLELAAGQDRLSPAALSATLSAGLRDALGAEPLAGPASPDRAKAVLVLRERATGAQYQLPTECATVREPARDGTDTLAVHGTAVLDPATAVSGKALADGAWDLHVRLNALGWTKTARLGSKRLPEVPLTERPHPDGGGRTVTPYWTNPHQDLSLRVGRPQLAQPQQTAAPRARNPLTRAIRRLRRPS